MAALPFFNSRKPRKYEHKPIYWDPQKEKREEREHRIRREMGMEEDPTEYTPTIKGTFLEGTTHLKKSVNRGDSADSRKYKSARLIVILFVLMLLAWFMFWR